MIDPPPPAAGAPAPPGPASARAGGARLRSLALGLGAASILLGQVLLFAYGIMFLSGMAWGHGEPLDTSAVCWIALVAATACGLAAVVLGLAHVESTGREEWGGVVLGLVGLVVPAISWILVGMYARR